MRFRLRKELFFPALFNLKTMKKIIGFILMFLGIVSQLYSQIELPKSNFSPGWHRAEKTLTFQKQALFNYINGGAELFHEFGFEKLIVQNYQKLSAELVLEIYQLESPAAALGIYLMKRGKETPFKNIPARNSGNRFQSTFVKNNYFIQINNFSGEEKIVPDMAKLANALLTNIPESDSVKLLQLLPEQNLIKGSEILFRGPYALDPVFTFGDGDIFQLGGKIFGMAGDYKLGEKSSYTLLLIPYPTQIMARRIFNHLLNNLDPYLQIVAKAKSRFVFRDYQNKYGIVLLRDNVIKIKIHLNQQPEN